MSAKLKKDALKMLQEKPMSLVELAQAMGLKEKRAFRILRSLFESEAITSFRTPDGARKYRALTDEERKTSAAGEEEPEELDEEEEDEE
jgi:DNA-binding PadR family transcriptional regulator